jgi:hypothetical protein
MTSDVNEGAALKGIGPGRPRKHAPVYRRPTWRETPPDDIAAQIERLASEHMSIARIAVELRTSKATLSRWLAEDPVLRECYDRGKSRAEHELYMLIVDAARTGEKLNMPAVYALNNRHGWRVEQADTASRVNITFNLPGALSREDYMRTIVAEAAAPTRLEGTK